MGKGKDSSSERSDHVSQPLSSLKDPASFGPPPKHVNYHGTAALSNQPTPDRQAGRAPLSHDQAYTQNVHQQRPELEQESAQKPPPPPVPYRVNTTGLSTDNLPPPPARRLDSPSSASPTSSKPKPPAPQLPPRLPPRNDSSSTSTPPPPPYSAVPPPSQGYVNQDATSRLSNAGVSVPALGIGEANGSSEPQSRFSQTRINSGTAPAPPTRASHGNIDSLPPPPGFRERHADKIDLGKQKLGGVTSRFNTFVEDRKFSANANKRIPRPPGPSSAGPVPASHAAPAPAPNTLPAPAPHTLPAPDVQTQAQRKKAPPPPPPKRAEMRATPATASPVSSTSPAPPPVPHNTRPR